MATAASQSVRERGDVSGATAEAHPELQPVPGLKENLSILDGGEARLALALVQSGQAHLFASWPAPGSDDDDKHRFFKQVATLDGSYPGGLAAYIANARKLLADSRDGKNPFDGYTPSVPTGERPKFGSEEFDRFEAQGVREARNAAFVLVAGGLGERLGYSGIKIALPAETTTNRCFLRVYIESILALQDASNALHPGEAPREVPFVIMTSDDTHRKTQGLLEEHSYFGMKPHSVHLLKQEKVACLADNDASVALDPKDKYAIQTKPHGHGDVHALLHSSGLLPQWQTGGVKWVLFFQDTNGLLFKAVPCSLGVSAVRGFDVNSLAVPRKAKEAIGGIARLKHRDGGEMVINVEYNQLDPMLRASGLFPDGDVNDPATGFSPFPGNINQLVIQLDTYKTELDKTNGAITEFVNPKYADASRTKFKSSTRLECMMQDFPKTLTPDHKVGFTELDVWLAYSPVKNNTKDAVAKVAAGTPAHSATTGEMHIYRANSLILREAGVEVQHLEASPDTVFAGQEVELWPRIVWSPRWALTFADVRSKVQTTPSSTSTSTGTGTATGADPGAGTGGSISISAQSTLVLEKADARLEALRLDGALVVDGSRRPDAGVISGDIKNKGWVLEPVDTEDSSLEECICMRGFKIVKLETEVV